MYRHLNDWELDDVEAFFLQLRGRLVRREEKRIKQYGWILGMGSSPSNLYAPSWN